MSGFQALGLLDRDVLGSYGAATSLGVEGYSAIWYKSGLLVVCSMGCRVSGLGV